MSISQVSGFITAQSGFVGRVATSAADAAGPAGTEPSSVEVDIRPKLALVDHIVGPDRPSELFTGFPKRSDLLQRLGARRDDEAGDATAETADASDTSPETADAVDVRRSRPEDLDAIRLRSLAHLVGMSPSEVASEIGLNPSVGDLVRHVLFGVSQLPATVESGEPGLGPDPFDDAATTNPGTDPLLSPLSTSGPAADPTGSPVHEPASDPGSTDT